MALASFLSLFFLCTLVMPVSAGEEVYLSSLAFQTRERYEQMELQKGFLGFDLQPKGNDVFDGDTVAVSDDGATVAVGKLEGAGSVEVFEFDDDTNTWTQKGQTLNGDIDGGMFGYSMDMDGFGTNIIVGQPFGGSEAGVARLYTYDAIADKWVKKSTVEGEAGDWAGKGVAMNGHGTRVVVGFPGFTGTVSNINNNGDVTVEKMGKVQIYDNVDHNLQLADTYMYTDQETATRNPRNVQMGTSVGMSISGYHVWVGMPGAMDPNGVRTGAVRYMYFGYTKKTEDIFGEVENEEYGISVGHFAYDLNPTFDSGFSSRDTSVADANAYIFHYRKQKIPYSGKGGVTMSGNQRMLVVRTDSSLDFYVLNRTWQGHGSKNGQPSAGFLEKADWFVKKTSVTVTGPRTRGCIRMAKDATTLVTASQAFSISKQYSSEAGLVYPQIGDIVHSETESDFRVDQSDGRKVVLNYDGTVMAQSSMWDKLHVKTFRLNTASNKWVQFGQTIYYSDFQLSGDSKFGEGLDINEDGTRIAISAPGEKGDARVFEYDATQDKWVQLGGILKPRVASNAPRQDGFGYGCKLADNGNVVAFGHPTHRTDLKGSVYVFKWDQDSSSWVKKGQDLESTSRGMYGMKLSMDATGNRLVVGAHEMSAKGTMFVYDYDDTNDRWEETYRQEAGQYYARFGSDVDISRDGKVIIVGAYTQDVPLDDDNEGEWLSDNEIKAKDAGYVFVYKDTGTELEQIYKTHGEDYFDKIGGTVSISGDGQSIAYGGPYKGWYSQERVSNAGYFEIAQFNSTSNMFEKSASYRGVSDSARLAQSLRFAGDSQSLAISSPGDNSGSSTGYIMVLSMTSMPAATPTPAPTTSTSSPSYTVTSPTAVPTSASPTAVPTSASPTAAPTSASPTAASPTAASPTSASPTAFPAQSNDELTGTGSAPTPAPVTVIEETTVTMTFAEPLSPAAVSTLTGDYCEQVSEETGVSLSKLVCVMTIQNVRRRLLASGVNYVASAWTTPEVQKTVKPVTKAKMAVFTETIQQVAAETTGQTVEVAHTPDVVVTRPPPEALNKLNPVAIVAAPAAAPAAAGGVNVAAAVIVPILVIAAVVATAVIYKRKKNPKASAETPDEEKGAAKGAAKATATKGVERNSTIKSIDLTKMQSRALLVKTPSDKKPAVDKTISQDSLPGTSLDPKDAMPVMKEGEAYARVCP